VLVHVTYNIPGTRVFIKHHTFGQLHRLTKEVIVDDALLIHCGYME